jgi:hypothetical protein
MSRQNEKNTQLGNRRGSRLLVGGRAGAAVLILLMAVCGSASWAEDAPPAAATVQSSTLPLFSDLKAVEVSELEEARGGDRAVVNLEEMIGQVSGNSIQGTVTTGASIVSGDAFQDLNGVSSVIINSGNNVSIQSSTTVNIVID